MLVAAIAVAALGFTPVAIADCGADHAALSASAEPAKAAAPERDAKAPVANDRTVASKTVKQKVAKVKSTTTDQKVAANAPR